MIDFFLFYFLYNGHFTGNSMETGKIEGTITLILMRYNAHFDFQQKNQLFIFS